MIVNLVPLQILSVQRYREALEAQRPMFTGTEENSTFKHIAVIEQKLPNVSDKNCTH